MTHGAAEGREISFNRDIRPILSDRCYYCHGFDENHREADLRLDIREEAEYVWDTDYPDDSELIYRITTDDPDVVMPP
ncbi:MAG: c-type cytochrome domain-containing protein, partial [Planctomycetota bacterium]